MEDKSQKAIKRGIKRMRKAGKGASNYCTSNIPKCDSDFPDILYGIWTEDKNMQLFAIKSLKVIDIDPVINTSGVIHRFVEFLEYSDCEIQSAAAEILACIAAKNANIVVQHGAIPILVNLMISSTHNDVHEQVLLALGNLAPNCRDLVLSNLIPFIWKLDEQTSSSVFQNAAYALSNFCGKTPNLSVLPALSRLIYLTDDNVLADTCWTLSQLSYAIDDRSIHAPLFEIVPRVVQLLEHSSQSVIISALRTVGNIVARSKRLTQAIIDFGALLSLRNLLKGIYNQSIKMAACWTISNIVAENKENITQALFDTGITSLLVTIVFGDPICNEIPKFVVKKEATWAISNVIYVASSDQIYTLILEDCVMALSRLLQCNDPRIVEVCLESLDHMVKFGPSGLALRKIEAYFGMLNIMQLREVHSDPSVRQKANMFLDSHWKSILVDYDFVDDDERIPHPRSTVTGAKRIDPCPPPFPILPDERLNPGLDLLCLKESTDVRVVNGYFDETRPIKRMPKLEDTSLMQEVRFRYYYGHLVFEGCPMGITNLVNDLSEPKVIQIDVNQNNSQILRILSKVGVPDGEDLVRELRMLMDRFKSSNEPACMDVYDFGAIDSSDECSLVRNQISTKLKSLLLK